MNEYKQFVPIVNIRIVDLFQNLVAQFVGYQFIGVGCIYTQAFLSRGLSDRGVSPEMGLLHGMVRLVLNVETVLNLLGDIVPGDRGVRSQCNKKIQSN